MMLLLPSQMQLTSTVMSTWKDIRSSKLHITAIEPVEDMRSVMENLKTCTDDKIILEIVDGELAAVYNRNTR